MSATPEKSASLGRATALLRHWLSGAAKPLLAVALSGGLLIVVLIALGASPVVVMAALIRGSCGSWLAFTETLVKATPLVFTGLAVSIAFRAALWNIGADGQLLLGALLATAVGVHLQNVAAPIAVTIVLAAGTLAGAFWGGICGYIRVRFRVSEVISTIMLNYVAVQLVAWAVHGPLIQTGGAYPASNAIAPGARLLQFLPPSRLNLGMVAALVLAVIAYIWLFHSRRGFELRAIGQNPRAAAFCAIPVGGLTIATLAISGALSGLGGAVQVAAITHRLYEQFSPGWGFEAIAVSLVARLNPIAVLGTALFFGALDNGAQAMQRAAGVSPTLVQVTEALVILVALVFETLDFSSVETFKIPKAQEEADV